MAADQPERSEKRPAREEIIELAPGVLRSELPIHMPGLGHVNCYLLVDKRGVAVVDPGLAGDGPWRALVDRLSRAGFGVKDVHSVVITHSHHDHYGGAPRLCEESGAQVVAHPRLQNRTLKNFAADDVEFLDPSAEAPDPSRDVRFGHTTPWGTWSQPPAEIVEHLKSLDVDVAMMETPIPDIAIPDGGEISLAERPWIGVYTPGHTGDHLCLYDPVEGLMLTGDHVLPTITPHISGWADEEAPLAKFFDSLNRMHDFADVKLALPAHGDPFEDLVGRADQICDHHVHRLDQIREAAKTLGQATVEVFMRATFKERSWGDMAASETYAHLDHLRSAGELSSNWVDGLMEFGFAKTDQSVPGER